MVGVSLARVMLIKADIPDGRSVGSGTLVGSSLVLTAAHVVFDDEGHPATHVEVGGVNAAPVTPRVIWPPSYGTATDDSRQLDAALVEITDPSWMPPRLPAVRWGRLTGGRPDVPCEATGFPRALSDPDGVRDTDQVSAVINPGSRLVAARYDLNVHSAVPTPLRDKPSPWAGLSGAEVFAHGLLIAVVIVDERGSYSGDRLSAVPVYRLAANAGFTTAVSARGGGLKGPGQLESVELDGVLTPLYRRPSRRSDTSSRSPAVLLRPEIGVVEFHGRGRLSSALIDWCTEGGQPVGVRLLTGPGGQGKTRLARHVADQLLHLPLPTANDPGWVCGFLNANVGEQDLAVLADTDAPLLLLIDYAETRTEQLRRLLPLLWDADTSDPVRVLLMARAAGEWWSGLEREFDGAPGEVTELGPLDPVEDRAAEFAAAVAAFADRLEDSAPSDTAGDAGLPPPPPDLDNDRYGSPLTLQLAALTALLETRQPLTEAAGGSRAEDTLLRHEERYWIDTAHSAGLDLSAVTLRRVVAAATLCGAGSFDDVRELAVAVPGIGDLSQDRLLRLESWLSGLYPPDGGQGWGSLQPDRLGEYVIATTLPGLLGALLSGTDAGRHHRVLTILARAISNPAITEREATTLSTQVRDALAGDLPHMGAIAMQVIMETADPRPMLAALHDATETADEAILDQLVYALPRFSQSLAELAAQWTAHRVGYLRDGAASAADPDAFRPELAGWLNNLSIRLMDVGRYEEALAAITEAVTTYRSLAAARPDVFTPDLVLALNNQSARLAGVGRYEEALAASTEAVTTYRRLAGAHPDAFEPDLAQVLNDRSVLLADLGRYKEALAAVTEAVTTYRKLVAADPEAFDPDLARSLDNQSARLADLDWYEDALAASTEAVTTYRRLAGAHPDAFEPHLAGALANQSLRLADLGRYEEALAAITEVATAYRKLAGAHPDVFNHDLAGSLNNQSFLLAQLDFREDALAAITEAVTAYRKLASAHPDAFEPDLAGSLRNQSDALATLGQYEDALAAVTEALDIYPRLTTQRAVVMPDVARSLRLQGVLRFQLGDFEGAASSDREAVSVYTALVSADPDRYRVDAADAIKSLELRLVALGRTEREVAEEVHRLRREVRRSSAHRGPNPIWRLRRRGRSKPR